MWLPRWRVHRPICRMPRRNRRFPPDTSNPWCRGRTRGRCRRRRSQRRISATRHISYWHNHTDDPNQLSKIDMRCIFAVCELSGPWAPPPKWLTWTDLCMPYARITWLMVSASEWMLSANMLCDPVYSHAHVLNTKFVAFLQRRQEIINSFRTCDGIIGSLTLQLL